MNDSFYNKLFDFCVFTIITISIICLIKKFQPEETETHHKDNLSEKDKFYRSLRHLIYILIALLFIPIGIKLLLLYGLLSL